LRHLAAASLLCLSTFGHRAEADSVTPPSGAVRFCISNPAYCEAHEPVSVPVSIMPTLQRINSAVNDGIVPGALDTDEQKRAEILNWRVVPFGGVGDCLEYAITKMNLLSYSGVPMGAMRLAQVRTPRRELHAVLLVRVKGIEVVLDNLTPVIWPTDSTAYEWVAVEDQTNGWAWGKPDGAPQ
jgi:predicted transglutaminase-like cysteine proteinase